MSVDAGQGRGFLAPPPQAAEGTPAGALQRRDREDLGFVMNLTWLWSHLPESLEGYAHLAGSAARTAGLTPRQRAVVVSACASAVGDSYCSLVWGTKLAGFVGPDAAAAVLLADDQGLDRHERVLADWARTVVTDPSSSTAEDVERLRAIGLSERQILALTLFVALRAAFAAVNGALGAQPDGLVAAVAPRAVRAAVAFGRPPSDSGRVCA